MNLNPGVIGDYLCMSPMGTDGLAIKWEDKPYANLYISHGEKEQLYHLEEMEKVGELLRKNGNTCEIKSFNCGHDYKMWNSEFLRILQILSPPSSKF